jgi:AcrR family transcriptional regulator
MPYPAQTDRETIIQTAREMIELEGLAQLSLARLAEVLGIKAPSLYRHVPSKTALIQAVNTLTFQKLFEYYETALAAENSDPTAQLLTILRAHRAFAQANPKTYILAFTTSSPEQRPEPAMLVQLALPLQELIGQISGPERSLAALRGALALVHGFVLLELNNQFQRGGNLDEAFATAIEAYLRGWLG